MYTPTKFFSVIQFGREGLKRILEIEEAKLPEAYPHPLKFIPKGTSKFQEEVKRLGYGRSIIRQLLP